MYVGHAPKTCKMKQVLTLYILINCHAVNQECAHIDRQWPCLFSKMYTSSISRGKSVHVDIPPS